MKATRWVAMGAVLCLAGSALAQGRGGGDPNLRPLTGQIVKVEGAKVSVKTMAARGQEAKDVVVTTDDKTAVTIEEKEAKVADLKAGLYVRVNPAEGTAVRIVASATAPNALRGQVGKVEDGKVTVKVPAGRGQEAREVVVATDDKTVVTIDGKEAKVADLKADLYVAVTPPEGTATRIAATTAAPPPRGRGARGGAGAGAGGGGM